LFFNNLTQSNDVKAKISYNFSIRAQIYLKLQSVYMKNKKVLEFKNKEKTSGELAAQAVIFLH
jgi:hypothetical protein